METRIPPTSVINQLAVYQGVERRIKPRILEPFQATVHGVSREGETFSVETVIDNISADGLYLRLSHQIEIGAEILVVSKLAKSSTKTNSGPLVAMHGVVRRFDCDHESACGVAVEFTHKRFL